MKRNMWNKIIAIGMAFGMLTANMPVLAFEDEMIVEDDSYIVVEDDTEAMLVPEADESTEEIFDDNLIIEETGPEKNDVFVQGIVSEETEEELQAAEGDIVDSGTCGKNITWTLDSKGNLEINGSGLMMDYGSNNAPFSSDKDIKAVVIGNGVQNIGRDVFYGCSLVSITIPDSVTDIKYEAFEGCSRLTSITIPSGVTSIGDFAFSNCTSLKDISISNSVTSIGYGAFERCTSLTEIFIPDHAVLHGGFAGCTNLLKINVSKYNDNYASSDGVLFDKSLTTLKSFPGGKDVIRIPNNIESIGFEAFAGNPRITEVEIPNSVSRIDEQAFWDCENLTSILIPRSVTWIGVMVFNNLQTLTFYGYTGSYAETYALENNIPFVALDGGDTPQGFHHTLDYYATTPSTTYNPELACDLMKLAWDAYGPNTVKDEHHVGTDEDIKEDYKSLGFDVEHDYYSDNYDKWAYFQDYCGFSFAVKESEEGDQIVAITIRGTVGGLGDKKHPYPSPEWVSNLLKAVPPILVTGWHPGFYNPACDILDSLSAKGLIESTNTKYFITGHSRGAGVGNVLAVLLSGRGISKDNIYAYNFACPDTMYAPAGTDWSGLGRYNNIFNINAANDLVGVVPGILGDGLGLMSRAIKGATVYTWGKYGKTYFYSFDWNNYGNSAVNVISFVANQGDTNPHQMSLYYDYLSKLNNTGSFKSYADVKINNLSYATSFLKCFTGFCPVDMTIVDGKGVDIVSVTNGEVIYHNNYGMKDAIVMTDGDFKAFFVDPSIDCKVKIKATDSGEMAFVSSLVNINTEEIKDEKHFENVTLENGKTFISEGLSKTDAGKVKLYTTDSKGNKVAEVNSDGKETKIVKRVTPKKVTEKITITKKPSIKKPAAAKGKITVKWKHFKHTSKKTKKIWKKIKKVQVQCATDKGFKNIVKTSTVKKSKTSAKIKGLKKKTTYYVRVRYFDGTGYSAWSKVKKVKTK